MENPAQALDDIARIRVPNRWAYTGPFRFVGADRDVCGLPSSFIQLCDGAVEARLDLRRRTLDDDRSYEGRVEVDADFGQAIARHVTIYPRYFSDIVGYKVHFHDLTVNDLLADAAFTRETVLGVTLGPRDSFGLTLKSRVFGRAALVAGYKALEGENTDSTQVIYEGAPLALDGEDRYTLHDLLRFLAGRRGASWLVEAFDGEGHRLGFYFQYHGGIEMNAAFLQPIDLRYRSPEIPVLAQSLPAMLEQLRDYRQRNPAKVAAMIHHYNDGAMQLFPTSRVRDLSVALETFVGAIRGKQPTRVPWLEEGFDKLIAPVLKTFNAEFLGVPDPPLGILRGKLLDINNASPLVDAMRYLDKVGVSPSAIESKTFTSYRNGILHSGHKGDEREIEDLRCNEEASYAFGNLFNRALLKALGYPGKYLELRTFESLPLDQAPSYPLLESLY